MSGYPIAAVDDFDREDGSALDERLWDVAAGVLPATCELQSGKLRYSSVTKRDYILRGAYTIAGDFDVQVDFDFVEHGSASQSWAAGLHLTVDGDSFIFWLRANYPHKGQVRYNFRQGSVAPPTNLSAATSDRSGKLRLVRSGSALTAYYWGGGSWVQVGGAMTMPTTSVPVGLLMYQGYASTLTVDWDNFAVNSGTIEWYTPPPANESLVAVFDQPYDLVAQILRAQFEQRYHLTVEQRVAFEQVYGLQMMAVMVQLYGDLPRLQAALEQLYGDAPLMTRQFDQPYGDLAALMATFEQAYGLREGVRAAFDQLYTLGGGELQAVFDQLYNVQDRDQLQAMFDQLYVLAAGDALLQAEELTVVCDGVAHHSIYNLFIEHDGDGDLQVAELQLLDEGEYLQYRAYQSEVVISLGDDTFVFLAQPGRETRRVGDTAYVVPLISRGVLLDYPHAAPVVGPVTGMASEIVAVLAAGVDVSWQMVDWYIPPGLLDVEGLSPLSVIKKIMRVAGGVLQSDPAGGLVCRAEYPVSVPDWGVVTPAGALSDQDDFFELAPDYDQRSGYNRYYLSDQQGGAGDGLRLQLVDRTGDEQELRVYLVPWDARAEVIMHHSGGDWVETIAMGVVETVIDEQVEFVAGAARRRTLPVYGLVAVDWRERDLGAVTGSEQGELTAAVADNSLAQMSYYTRYHSYIVRNPRREDVQFYPEVVYGG